VPDAAEAYRRALALEPASALVHRNLADALARQGQAESARAEWKRCAELGTAALRVNSRDLSVLASLAICQAKLGDRDAALGTAATALQVAPADREPLYAAAAVHALVGDPARGLGYLEQAFQRGASATRASRDDDLANLRALPGFPPLMARFAPRQGG
jgi:Tfp pilus assembly protein PilF